MRNLWVVTRRRNRRPVGHYIDKEETKAFEKNYKELDTKEGEIPSLGWLRLERGVQEIWIK